MTRVCFSNRLGVAPNPAKGFDDKRIMTRKRWPFRSSIGNGSARISFFRIPDLSDLAGEGFAACGPARHCRAQGQDQEFLDNSPDQGQAAQPLALVQAVPRAPGVIVRPYAEAGRLPPRDLLEQQGPSVGDSACRVKYIASLATVTALMSRPRRWFAEDPAHFLQAQLKRHIEQPLDMKTGLLRLLSATLGGRSDDWSRRPGPPVGRILEMGRRHDAGVERRRSAGLPSGQDLPDRPGAAACSEICDNPANFINSSINTLPEHQGLGRISRAERSPRRRASGVERRSDAAPAPNGAARIECLPEHGGVPGQPQEQGRSQGDHPHTLMATRGARRGLTPCLTAATVAASCLARFRPHCRSERAGLELHTDAPLP